MERNSQLVGPLGLDKSNRRVAVKFRFMRGQKSGSGQRVKKKVNARARPRKSEKWISLPVSVISVPSGKRSPGLSSGESARKTNVLLVTAATWCATNCKFFTQLSF